jgi:hypothetical protein
MRDLCAGRLLKSHTDLEDGEAFSFFRRDGGEFRRSPQEYKDI